MKRSFIFFSLMIAACTELSPLEQETSDGSQENAYTLQGSLCDQTRTAFEEQTDGGYRMVWSSGDEIGIFSYDLEETANINVKATLQESSAGCANGVFDPEIRIYPSWNGDVEGGVAMPVSESETFLVYYPYRYRTDIDVDDLCIHSTLEREQHQNAVSDRKVGQNGFSYAYATVNPGARKIEFTLENAMAYVRAVINSTELEGYRFRSFSISDAGNSAKLSGDFVFDTDNREIRTVGGKTFPYATVNVVPSDFSAPAAPEELYLTIFPGDYSSAQLYADLSFVNASGNAITIPVKLGNFGNVSPGSIRTLPFSNVGRGTCPAWYEPEDNRDFCGGTAYGAQNTFLVEEGGSVTFDVKARGNFSKAVAPKYYGIMLASNLKNEGLLQMPDGVEAYEQAPTRKISDDYKITVNCKSGTSASFGVVAIYDENHNVLWSYMIWKYGTGDPVQSVSYAGIPDCSFMDRALGARRGIAAAVAAGKALEGAAYFTWGRKDPFPWKNQIPTHYLTEVGAGHDLQYAIAHPNVKMQDVSNGLGYWYGNETDNQMRKDLWGAENRTTSETRGVTGHKTIYDPCPEGYRVPDYDALCRVSERKHLAEIEFASSDNRYTLQHDASVAHLEMPCPFSDMSAFAIQKTDGSYDYWLYHGNFWADGSWSNATPDASRSGYCYWSNTNQSSTKYRASIIRGWYNGAGTKWSFDYSDKMAGSYPVRCQKITE